MRSGARFADAGTLLGGSVFLDIPKILNEWTKPSGSLAPDGETYPTTQYEVAGRICQTFVSANLGIRHELAQHEREDAAVNVVVDLDRSVDP